ncbi:MAG: hypothetical protein D6820_03730, partial [Lentisphaerae bacterium]
MQAQKNSTKPNLVVILVDQLRRNAVHHLGGPVPTPALDQLAEEGVSFPDAFCVSPMCTPARAALLTGRLNHALHDVNGNPYYFNDHTLSPQERTLAHILSEHGYACGYAGKWHLIRGKGDTPIPRGPLRLGFDDFWAGINCGSRRTHPWYW